MKKISASLFIATLMLSISVGAMAQKRILQVVKNGQVVLSELASDIDYITVISDYVDLGLPSGVKWASCNLGAETPEEYGDLYGWGCTKPYNASEEVKWPLYFEKIGGSGSKAADCGISSDPLNSYVNDKVCIAGTKWDAARSNLVGSWRMPTKEEFQELIDYCDWTWTTVNGVYGYKVVSKDNSDKYIFLPAAGYHEGSELLNQDSRGNYWTSTPYEENAFDTYRLFFDNSSPSMGHARRDYGRSIRPVTD